MRSCREGFVLGAIAASAIVLTASWAGAMVTVIGLREVRFAWAPAPGAPDGYGVSVARNGGPPVFFDVVSTPSVDVPVSPGDQIAIEVQAWRLNPDRGYELGPRSELSELVWVFPAPELPVAGEWTLACASCPSVAIRSLADASTVEIEAPSVPTPWRLVGRASLSSGSDALVWYHPAYGGIGLWDADDLLAVPGGQAQGPRDARYVGAADFDRDGLEEIAFFDHAIGAIHVFGLTAGGLELRGGVMRPAGADPAALGDFTGDGAIEIAWLFPGARTLELRRLDGSALGRVADSVPSPGLLAGGIGYAAVADAGDYDGDGHLDLLLRRPDGGLFIVYLEAGRYRRLANLPAIQGDEGREVVGSVDADGIEGLEIALRDSASGVLSLLFPSDEQNADRLWVLTPGSSWAVVDVR